MTVGQLFERHLRRFDEAVKNGEKGHKTRRDYLPLPHILTDAGIIGKKVKDLRKSDFAAVKRSIQKSSKSLKTQSNKNMYIRAVFNWGYAAGYNKKVNFGDGFAYPERKLIRKQQKDKKKEYPRFIDRETILQLLEVARPSLKVAILLGINCAFYPGDSIAITLSDLYLDSKPYPYHDFARAKNLQERVAILWPETVHAIRDYVINYRSKRNPNELRLLLTQYGKPYTKAGEGRKLIESFNRLLVEIGKKTQDVSLGSLRHTFSTVVNTVQDLSMIDLVMGHTPGSLRQRVYVQFHIDEKHRLKAVSDHVHDWLFGQKESNHGHQEKDLQHFEGTPETSRIIEGCIGENGWNHYCCVF